MGNDLQKIIKKFQLDYAWLGCRRENLKAN